MIYAKIFFLWGLSVTVLFLSAQRQTEYLNRGIYAQRIGEDVFLSWRLLVNEPDSTSFNIYREVDGKFKKINKNPLRKGTNFWDRNVIKDKDIKYFVTPIGINEKSESYILLADAKPFINIPLKTPTGYTPNDIAIGDVDGDGQYEIFLHQTKDGKDNSQKGKTGTTLIQCYTLGGKFLWQIDLGKNIREGAHYTQMVVYDLNGDGKSELILKTADGTIDGVGNVIGDSSKDYRNTDGRILEGAEYLTVFDGITGKAVYTTGYVPQRGDVGGWGGSGGNGKNDAYGNRVDRFLACIAYLDGKHPSVVMCRGYYGRSVLAAWDYNGKSLTQRWVFDTKDGNNPYSGQGNHNLVVSDVDRDGKDEIVYGSICVDDNGRGLYSMGLRHGDAVHVGMFSPFSKNQIGFGVHELEESRSDGYGSACFDASNGHILWTANKNIDVGRGLAADIDPRYPGYECWGGRDSLRSINGVPIGKQPSSTNFKIWWDGDDLCELLDGTKIFKWDYIRQKLLTLADFSTFDCVSNNGTKATPALCADLLGDWREEVIFRTKDNKSLMIFSTAISTDRRLYSLMQNSQYRLSIVWQNVGYNQPAYTDYYLGNGMPNPLTPNVTIVSFKN